jgi:dolichol-phosphate mannosyltransferase
MQKISLIVAAFNEEQNIPVLYARIAAIDWTAIQLEFEMVVVDDHSSDRTPQVVRALVARDPRVKLLRFSRNFGSHKAYTAGLEQCTGDAAIILAADLQDPPETIPNLVVKWREGSRVVWAVRSARAGETAQTKFFSRLYWHLMRRYAEVEPPRAGADFLLVDRQVVEVLKTVREKHTSLLSLIQWLGFDQAFISYEKKERLSGTSKWTLRKKLKLAVDSFVSFSYFPIRVMSLCGIVFAASGFIYAGVVAARAFFWGSPVQGWSSLMCVVLIVSGVQLLMLGVLGEYLWRTFDESRHRPRFVIEERVGF